MLGAEYTHYATQDTQYFDAVKVLKNSPNIFRSD